ncbi:unc-13-like C [Paramuricea clavata]|uniref:Unc-13-like C n=1 Tax=Paramuricea clavata TaxID=317549 RepID=A0A7D9DU12_PARCT|nr:unc-13-like C [Paramuricea clavata]
MNREIVDIKARSMRNNLLIFNIPESENEYPEKCVEKVYEILQNKLEIDDASSKMPIERAHRIGRNRRGNPRPIVVKFLRYPDKELVKRSASKLKGTSIGIGEQFPKDIADIRKSLYPVLKKAKEEGNKVKLVKDKLYINGQLYYGK